MVSARQACFFLVLTCWTVYLVSPTPFSWMKRDAWDIINEKFTNVTAQNCRSKNRDALTLPENSVSGIPKYNRLLSTRIFANRTQLLHVHNMALNRAFFYSMIYQRLNNTWDFDSQPGLLYIYMSATADVSGSIGWINGSALYFGNNCSYPNWYTTLPFNDTIPLFAPVAWRVDDWNEPTNFLREPTNRTINVWDLATGNSRNYTDPRHRGNPFIKLWLPDRGRKDENDDSTTKFTYSVGIKYSNMTGKFTTDTFQEFNFFGPQQPGSQAPLKMLPVRFTPPYFDCGNSNKWVVTASSPVVEYMRRYVNFTHIRRPQFTAVSTMSMEYYRIDINQCPKSKGNNDPNIFAGTDKCRPHTMCEPLPGFGFNRGGYQCVCLQGHYYPWWHDGPFQGRELEQATYDEWMYGSDCLTTQDRVVNPSGLPSLIRKSRSVASPKDIFMHEVVDYTNQSPRLTKRLKRRLIPRLKDAHAEMLREKREAKEANPKIIVKKRHVAKHKVNKAHRRQKRETIDENAVNRMEKIMNRFNTINAGNCDDKLAYELFLPGDAGYGSDTQFEGEGRTALRLAHFLSNFLQNVDEYEEYGNLKGDRRLNETQLFAEVISNVMADFKILGAGIFFDRYKFRMSPPLQNEDPRFVKGITREYFGPYAWSIKTTLGGVGGASFFRAMDYAGLKTPYVDEQWFRNMKARWATNLVNLETFRSMPMIRSNFEGTSLVRFEYYPLTYKAVKYEDGEWLRPQFKCDGRIDKWVVTYLAPFFGKDDIGQKLEFKGIVSVDVNLNQLVFNQCPGNFHKPNAFKNTAKCHFESQVCVSTHGAGNTLNMFKSGYYKCDCRQGFEYPFLDQSWYFDGQMMESEYDKYMRGEPNRYETLKCRIAGASGVTSSLLLTLVLVALNMLTQRQ